MPSAPGNYEAGYKALLEHTDLIYHRPGQLNTKHLNRSTIIQRIVNDFSITIGTVNGSGSQTANVTLLRALFKMGIPVSGKNIFPSNIQGLPTWYTIRVSKDGFTRPA